MTEVTEYKTKIQDLLTELAAYGSSDREVESQLVFDVERNHYQLMHVGWRNQRRIYGCVVHLDIKDETSHSHDRSIYHNKPRTPPKTVARILVQLRIDKL